MSHKVTIWGGSRFTYEFVKKILSNKSLIITNIITTNKKTIYKRLFNLLKSNNIPFTDIPTVTQKYNIVASYGRYIKSSIFDKQGTHFVNVHPSLLPKYRGANPIIGSLLGMESQTGITFHKMSKKIDEGPIYKQYPYQIKSRDTALTLEIQLAKLGALYIPYIIENIQLLKPYKQGMNASYTSRTLTNMENSQINWRRGIKYINYFVRAYYNNPIAWSFINKKIIKIFPGEFTEEKTKYTPGQIILSKVAPYVKIACKDGCLLPDFVHIEGKRKLNTREFSNGYHNLNGIILNKS